MNSEILREQVELLTIFVDEYKKHPAYRAIDSATGRCEPCVKAWQACPKLRSLDQ